MFKMFKNTDSVSFNQWTTLSFIMIALSGQMYSVYRLVVLYSVLHNIHHHKRKKHATLGTLVMPIHATPTISP